MSTFENIQTEELLKMLADARQNEVNFKNVTANMIAEVNLAAAVSRELSEGEREALIVTELIRRIP